MCLNCTPACLVCTGPTAEDCTVCNTTFYLFLARTTCFTTCPITYFGKNSTMTCELCGDYCLRCVDETECTLCDTGYPLYQK